MMCGCSLVVKHGLPKAGLRVRFPSSAPKFQRFRAFVLHFVLHTKKEPPRRTVRRGLCLLLAQPFFIPFLTFQCSDFIPFIFPKDFFYYIFYFFGEHRKIIHQGHNKHKDYKRYSYEYDYHQNLHSLCSADSLYADSILSLSFVD